MTSTSDEVGHTLDLEAIEARANAATQGPWEHVPTAIIDGEGFVLMANNAVKDEDYAFIAHARTDIPALIDECRSLRNSHDSLVKALEKTTDWIVALAASGDAGFWDGEKMEEVIEARSALSQAKGGK